LSPALASALRRAAEEQARHRRVPLAPAQVVRKGIARRAADQVPFTQRPISILRPVPEDPIELREFVLQQFPPPARRLAR
jgi:hypothetical protein